MNVCSSGKIMDSS